MTVPAQENNRDNFDDTPKASLINLLLKLASKLIMWFVKKQAKKEAENEVKLQKFKNYFIEKSNKRIDRINLNRSVDKLCAEETTSSDNSKADTNLQPKR